jgi:hypothetical protein
MTSTHREVWKERVEAWKASGKSAVEFATGQAFAATTLQRWAYTFRGAKKKTTSGAAAGLTILPAVRRGAAAGGGHVAIEAGGVRVLVEPGFDAKLLREVIFALEHVG